MKKKTSEGPDSGCSDDDNEDTFFYLISCAMFS
jgi:hypothetical protein